MWYRIRPTPTSGLDFTYPDRQVHFAERHGQLVIGFPLVWDEGFGPGWTDDDLWGMSAQRARHVLYSTVHAMVHRYRGRIPAWIVANEVTNPDFPGGLRRDVPWYNTIGPSYVAESFRIAHHADPHALLAIQEDGGMITVNQYGDKPVPRQRAFLEVIDRLQRQNVPVHAAAIEGRLLAYHFKERFHRRQFQHFLNELRHRGLKILITEMDALDLGLPASTKVRDHAVAEAYRIFLDTVLENEDVIALILFGLTDRWTEESDDNPRPDGLPERPCPFDTHLRPKPAYWALREALDNAPRRHPYWVPPKARHHHH
jgi:endo-1,4-beta-xylanase